MFALGLCAFGFGEDTHQIRWVNLKINATARLFAVLVFVGISAAFATPLWRSATLMHVIWVNLAVRDGNFTLLL